jgi:hypothetical protein
VVSKTLCDYLKEFNHFYTALKGQALLRRFSSALFFDDWFERLSYSNVSSYLFLIVHSLGCEICNFCNPRGDGVR